MGVCYDIPIGVSIGAAMTEKIEVNQTTQHHDRSEHNKANINRIRRIQGQLESLAKVLEADEGSCEDRVIRARTVEKGVTSLINHLITCYIDNTLKYEMQTNPDAASEEIASLLKLLNR
jgi:DNA-binding FrmR family transcriptional regulator